MGSFSSEGTEQDVAGNGRSTNYRRWLTGRVRSSRGSTKASRDSTQRNSTIGRILVPNNEYGLLNEWNSRSASSDGLSRIIFHEYGKYDIHLSGENAEFGEILQRRTNTVVSTTREYNGGHDYLSWRRGITEGHQWIREQRN